MIDFLIQLEGNVLPGGVESFFLVKPATLKRKMLGRQLILFSWGDPIGVDEAVRRLPQESSAEATLGFLLREVRGHYYFLIHDAEDGECLAGNSLFGILPVYYQHLGDSLLLANDPLAIARRNGHARVNKRFFLENVLFNYPLFNESCIEGVRLLPANSYVRFVRGLLTLRKHTRIENHFFSDPVPWRNSVGELSDLFIRRSAGYFPDGPSMVSLTAGFDGRTLLACGLFHRKSVAAFTFGTADSEDLRLAAGIAGKENVDFHPIALDAEYLRHDSLNNGIEFVHNAAGGAAFARAHYLFAAKRLFKRTHCIVTGDFGSEVLRNNRAAGAVVSPNLHAIFAAKDFDAAVRRVQGSTEFGWLNRKGLRTEWEAVVEDLKNMSRFNPLLGTLSLNQRFNIVIFEEVFRKYFGAELSSQFKHIANRTPFLDFEFLIHLWRSKMAPAYAPFFDRNPMRRFRGQVLYHHIIRKAHPSLGSILTDKGYRPDDLQGITGKTRIFWAFLKKRIQGRTNSMDPYAVAAAFRLNSDFFQSVQPADELFNAKSFAEAFALSRSDNGFFVALSQAHFHDRLRRDWS